MSNAAGLLWSLSCPHSSVVPQNFLEQSQTPYGACQALLTWTAWHTPPSPCRAMLTLPPPRAQAEGLLPSLRGPLTLPRHLASLSRRPCHFFQRTRKVLQHFLDKLNPGLCTWLAKHPAQHLRTLTCTAAPGPGVREAWPLSYVQEAARTGGPAAQAKDVCGLGKALGTGQPSGNPCPCPPSPLLWNKHGGLGPFMLDRLVSEGPSRKGINAGSQALSSHRTVCPGVRMRGALCLLGNRKARRKSSRQLVEGSNPHTKGPHFKSLPL